jgi:hypothetical protein
MAKLWLIEPKIPEKECVDKIVFDIDKDGDVTLLIKRPGGSVYIVDSVNDATCSFSLAALERAVVKAKELGWMDASDG